MFILILLFAFAAPVSSHLTVTSPHPIRTAIQGVDATCHVGLRAPCGHP